MAAAHEMAARAATYPPKLQRVTKTEMGKLPDIDTSPQAVEHEVRPQVASMASPEFQALVSKLQTDISSKG